MTLELDLSPEMMKYFEELRTLYFPKHKLKDNAHLTILYQIHDTKENIISKLNKLKIPTFSIAIKGVALYENGNAILLDAPELMSLQHQVKKLFYKKTSRRDLVKYKPHITVQLGVTNFKAIKTNAILKQQLKDIPIKAEGMSLWEKQNGQNTLIYRWTFE